MAVLAANINGHIQNQLTRSLERILEDANQSGELKLSNRKLKDFPKASSKYNLSDTVIAGRTLIALFVCFWQFAGGVCLFFIVCEVVHEY